MWPWFTSHPRTFHGLCPPPSGPRYQIQTNLDLKRSRLCSAMKRAWMWIPTLGFELFRSVSTGAAVSDHKPRCFQLLSGSNSTYFYLCGLWEDSNEIICMKVLGHWYVRISGNYKSTGLMGGPWGSRTQYPTPARTQKAACPPPPQKAAAHIPGCATHRLGKRDANRLFGTE